MSGSPGIKTLHAVLHTGGIFSVSLLAVAVLGGSVSSDAAAKDAWLRAPFPTTEFSKVKPAPNAPMKPSAETAGITTSVAAKKDDAEKTAIDAHAAHLPKAGFHRRRPAAPAIPSNTRNGRSPSTPIRNSAPSIFRSTTRSTNSPTAPTETSACVATIRSAPTSARTRSFPTSNATRRPGKASPASSATASTRTTTRPRAAWRWSRAG